MEYSYQCDDLYVIVTRFNVNINYSVAKTKTLAQINPAVDEGYLARRFELFERYTIPSIQQQTLQNFIWLVLFHADTPQHYKDRIAALQQEYPAFRPLFVQDDEDYLAAMDAYLLSFAAKRYISARIDNDDAFHAGFMQAVQEIVQKDTRVEYMILFALGLQYHEKKQFATKYNFPMNHFSALITPNLGDGTLKNILTYNHTTVTEFFEIEMVSQPQPMWLEVVHDSNVSNRMHVKRDSIVREDAQLVDFGGKIHLGKHAVRTASLYAAFSKPINAIRLYKMYGTKGIVLKVKEKLKR